MIQVPAEGLLTLCQVCGAFVGDTEVHLSWHEAARKKEANDASHLPGEARRHE